MIFKIKQVAAQFARIYLGGIPSLLNDDGAFLSFICILTGIEALGGFLNPTLGNGQRFTKLVQGYFPDPFPAQAETLWTFRNTMVHAFSPRPYALTHHNSHVHLTQDDEGRTVLNAEDFYAALVFASRKYFDSVAKDPNLQSNLLQRINADGILSVGPMTQQSGHSL